jgi:MSHA biogenesis protein MshN
MSLLNEMLKDLSRNKSKEKLPFSLVVHEKKTYFQSLSKSLPVLFFVLSCLIFLGLLISYKGRLAQTKPSDLTAEVTHGVISNPSAPQEDATLISQAAQKISAEEWRPSVLVPAPIFSQNTTTDDVFSNNIQDPFPDEDDNGGVNKVFSGLSPKEWYNEQFNKALDYIEAGNNHEAIYVLELILLKFPAASDVRESLAAIYFSEGEVTQAENIINEGLRVQPNALNLNVMKARILYEQSKAEEALSLLSRFHPNIQEEPDFYGLRAAILQSLGRTNEAGSLYKALIELQPNNSQYWLGYGMALEQKHAVQQAVAAYKKVGEGYDVEPAVRSYAEDRLKNLQG